MILNAKRREPLCWLCCCCWKETCLKICSSFTLSIKYVLRMWHISLLIACLHCLGFILCVCVCVCVCVCACVHVLLYAFMHADLYKLHWCCLLLDWWRPGWSSCFVTHTNSSHGLHWKGGCDCSVAGMGIPYVKTHTTLTLKYTHMHIIEYTYIDTIYHSNQPLQLYLMYPIYSVT